MLEAIDNGSVSVLLLLGLSAAFDTVDHAVLLERLKSRFGIKGAVLAWFHSYLTKRQQIVCIGKETSVNKTLPYGVPQGSVLGPSLFSVYTTPLGDIMKHHGIKYHLYADDTQLYVSFCPAPENQTLTISKLEGCLSQIKSWMDANFLKLNQEKTELIIFGTRQKLSMMTQFSINVTGTTIKPSLKVRNLGVILDQTLSMKPHIDSICRSTYMHLRNISRIRKFLTEDATKSLIHSLVISRLDYGNVLLVGVSKEQIHRLQRIQNTACRIVTHTSQGDHITPALKHLHWLPVHRRVEYKLMLYVYKSINGLAPPYLSELVTLKQFGRSLRSQNQALLAVPKTRLVTFGDRSFRAAGAKIWNGAPMVLKCQKTVASFKGALKHHLFKVEYDSM